MEIRDRIYAPYEVVFILSGVRREVTDGLAGALLRLLRDPLDHPIRTRWPARGGAIRKVASDEFEGLVAASIHVVADGQDGRSLIAAAKNRGYAGLPISISISGPTVAFAVPHAVFDGAGALELVQYLVYTAAGEPYELDRRELAKHPLLTAARTVSRQNVKDYFAYRNKWRLISPPAPQPTEAQSRLESAQYVATTLDSTAIDRVKKGDDPAGQAGRASLNTRLASVAIAALRDVYRSDAERPVTLSMDGRRYVRGKRVVGNFSASLPFGGLLTGDWSPSTLTTRFSHLAASNAPIIFLLLGAVRVVRSGAKSLRSPMTGPHGISVSLVSIRTDFPRSIWIDGDGYFGAATIGPWPSATFICVTTLGKSVRIAVWDESGDFELDRFTAALTHEIDARIPA